MVRNFKQIYVGIAFGRISNGFWGTVASVSCTHFAGLQTIGDGVQGEQ